MLWLFLAQAAAQPASPPNHFPDTAGLLNYMDAPSSLFSGGDVVRVVYTRTTIRDDGGVERCVSEQTSGDSRLDAHTCAIITHRARFSAAHWLDGTPAYSVFRAPFLWSVGEARPDPRKMIAPDLQLVVKQMPAGVAAAVNLLLEIAVDAGGAIVSCRVRDTADGDRTAPPAALVPVACRQLTSQLKMQPPLNRAGQPVRSIQTASVRFAVAP